jgi:hypothetical protein
VVKRFILAGGKAYIRSKQAKEVKAFVTDADTLIAVMTSNLLEFLEHTNIEELITHEEAQIKANYKSFLSQRHENVQIQNEKDYLELKSSLEGIRSLQQQTIAATRNLRAVHARLFLDLKAKRSIEESIKGLQTLYEEVKGLKRTFLAIEVAKQNEGL